MRTWIIAVLVAFALLLVPLHHATAGVALVNHAAGSIHGSRGADHPCAPDHRTGTDQQPLVCGGAASGCIFALSPLLDPVSPPTGANVEIPAAVEEIAGWDHTPTPPPPRTFNV